VAIAVARIQKKKVDRAFRLKIRANFPKRRALPLARLLAGERCVRERHSLNRRLRFNRRSRRQKPHSRARLTPLKSFAAPAAAP
jgi:hypothetical protein